MRLSNLNKLIIIFILFIGIVGIGIYKVNGQNLGASVIQVYQGGTGASTFNVGECLVGNGTAAISSQACGAGGGSTFATTSVSGLYPLSWDTSTAQMSTVATSSLNLTVGTFLSPNISQWTNDSNYIDATSLTPYLLGSDYYATTTHSNITSIPKLSITKSQVSDFGTYSNFAYPFPSSATSSPLNFTGLITMGNASTTQISSTGSAYFATSNGNVGIGTTSPYARLSVVGQSVSEYYTAISTSATSTFPRLTSTGISSDWLCLSGDTCRTTWPTGGTGSFPAQLGQIGDVSTTTPMNYGDMIRYDTGTSKWVSTSTPAGIAVETDPVWTTDKTSYVPYMGATTDLDLGSNALYVDYINGQIGSAFDIYASDGGNGLDGQPLTLIAGFGGLTGGGNGGNIRFRAGGGQSDNGNGGDIIFETGQHTALGSGTDGNYKFKDPTLTYSGILDFSSLTADKTFTFPNQSGTLALTSNYGSQFYNYFSATTTDALPQGSTNKYMAYPGAGIALSTGSAWDTPITNNSGNWNTAYTNRVDNWTYPLSFSSNTASLSNMSTSTITCAGSASCGAGSFVIGNALTITGNGLTAYDAFTHPAVGQSATTSLMVLNGKATTTQLTVSGNTYLPLTGILKGNGAGNALTVAANGTDYTLITAQSCTNQVITALTALGGSTCSSVSNAMLTNSTISGISLGSNLANLSATDTTLTFSGTYNGGTARTIGLNLANPNTWTGLQTFGNASTTLISAIGAGGLSLTDDGGNGLLILDGGNIGIASSSPAKKLSLVGQLYVGGSASATSTIQGNFQECNSGATHCCYRTWDTASTTLHCF